MSLLKVQLALATLVIGLLPFSANAVELGFVNSNIWTSKTNAIVGEHITLFAVLVNSSDTGLSGNVVFINENNSQPVGNPVPFALSGGGTSNVLSAVWVATVGEHRFRAKIIDAMSVDSLGRKTPLGSDILSQITGTITVGIDTDKDGVTDTKETTQGTDPKKPDTDNDGLNDSRDPNPLKPDTDGDGDKDGTDPNPTNPNVFTPPDADKDGLVDNKDTDKDNDGLYNWQETRSTGGIGTDPLKYDTDKDGVGDKQDAYPLDPKRWKKETQLGNVDEPVTTTLSDVIEPTETVPVAEGEVLGEKINRSPFIGDTVGSIFPWWFKYMVSLWLVLLLIFITIHYKKRKKEIAGSEFEPIE